MSIVQAGVLGVMGALLAVQFKMENRIWNLYECGQSVFYFLSHSSGRLEEIINTIRQISGTLTWIPLILQP